MSRFLKIELNMKLTYHFEKDKLPKASYKPLLKHYPGKNALKNE